MTKFVSYTVKNKIATVVIDNPPMNVLSTEVIRDIGTTFDGLKEDQDVIAIILTGKGHKAFVAGADIKGFASPDQKQGSGEIHQVFNAIADLPKPTIAVLNGFTLGGGLELALTCDIRIAEAHIKLGLPEISLGLLPGGGGTQRLPRLIGTSLAKEMILTGKHITAKEAETIHLVNQVVASGEGLVAAEKLAKTFTEKSLQAISRIKTLVNLSEEKTLSQGLEAEAKAFNELFETEDAKEGIQAFIEKRKPIFKHR